MAKSTISKIMPARLLAVFLVDTNETEPMTDTAVGKAVSGRQT